MSEYIANLNAIPSAQDLQASDNLNFEDDLALFTNTQFFDFDLGQDADLQQTFDTSATPRDHTKPVAETVAADSFDFGNGEFAFPEFNFDSAAPQATSYTDVLPAPAQAQHPYFPAPSTVASPTAIDGQTPGTTAQKRKASSSPLETELMDEDSRAAAEEDKRRRNTAASARFRVKKKQREQALEKSAKEMSDKVAALEGRINQLETENKWLKNLVTEKNESKEDIATLWKKYSAEKESSTEARTKGVGTA